MTGDPPACLRGTVGMLLWVCSMICAVIHTTKPAVRCKGNMRFPLHCQVCQVPPDVLNVSRVQPLLCSRSSNCYMVVFFLEMLLLRLLGLFLISAYIFLILLTLFSKSVLKYYSNAYQILLVF